MSQDRYYFDRYDTEGWTPMEQTNGNGTRRRQNQINVLMPDELLNEMYAALYTADGVGRGPRDLTDIVTTAVGQYLVELRADINNGEPFSQELGQRLRARRRR